MQKKHEQKCDTRNSPSSGQRLPPLLPRARIPTEPITLLRQRHTIVVVRHGGASLLSLEKKRKNSETQSAEPLLIEKNINEMIYSKLNEKKAGIVIMTIIALFRIVAVSEWYTMGPIKSTSFLLSTRILLEFFASIIR